jgi:chromosome partitioning protein
MMTAKKITICIANHKGGVGKTTTAVNLATGFAGLGHPTVLLDCDPQHNCTDFLKMQPGPALFDMVVHRTPATSLFRRYKDTRLVVLSSETASTVDLETLFRTPAARLNPATAIRDALKVFQPNGNGKPVIIIIDTAPSLSSIQISALAAADWLLIPATPEYASETGISALVQAVADLQETGAGLQLLGILPTMVSSTAEHRQTIAGLHAAFPGLILTPIRRRIAIAEAPGRGLPIWEYDPRPDGAGADYAALLSEIGRRVGL